MRAKLLWIVKNVSLPSCIYYEWAKFLIKVCFSYNAPICFFTFRAHVSESASVDCVEIPFVSDSFWSPTPSKCSLFFLFHHIVNFKFHIFYSQYRSFFHAFAKFVSICHLSTRTGDSFLVPLLHSHHTSSHLRDLLYSVPPISHLVATESPDGGIVKPP